jgi:hypothetical protein
MKTNRIFLRICFVFLVFIVTHIFLVISESAEDTKITVELYPQGDTTNPISLIFNGKVYTESWWFDEVVKNTFIASDDEKFIINVVETNQKGTPEDVLTLWSPAERDQMKSIIFDTDAFAGNQGFYKRIQSSAFMAKILYGSYIIFLIQHTGNEIGNLIHEYPTLKVDNNYYLTNKLQSDPMFLFMTEKYSKTLKYKQRQ